MTLSDFTGAVAEIAKYLGSTPFPSADVIAAWFERVAYIPDDAVQYIVRRITDDAERMPKNLPKLFRALHQEWQAEHAKPTAPTQQPSCGDCDGGILWLEKPGTGETAVIYCTCYRGHPGAVGRASLATMRRQGWERIDLTHKYVQPTGHDQLAGQIQQARMDYSHPDYRQTDTYEDCPY